MLYYKKRLSGGEAIDLRLNGHEPDDGSDRGMRARFVLPLSAYCEIRNCLPKEEANGIQIKSQIRRRQNI